MKLIYWKDMENLNSAGSFLSHDMQYRDKIQQHVQIVNNCNPTLFLEMRELNNVVNCFSG